MPLHRVSLLFFLGALQLCTPSDMLMDSDTGNAVYLKKNNGHPFPNPCIQRIPFWDITLLRVIGSRRFETKISSWTFRPLKMRQLGFVEIRWPIDAWSYSTSTKSSAARLRKPPTHPFHCVRFKDSLDKLWRNCTMEEAFVRSVLRVDSSVGAPAVVFLFVAANRWFIEWHHIARWTVDKKDCKVALTAIQSRCHQPSLCQPGCGHTRTACQRTSYHLKPGWQSFSTLSQPKFCVCPVSSS